MLPRAIFHAIVPERGYVAAAFTFVALPVRRALCPSLGSCRPDVEAGAAQGVPCLLLLCHF